MSEASGGTTSANVNAIVEALDRRAKQAGVEGAELVVQSAIRSVGEALDAIEDRLARLETAFVRALEGSSAAPEVPAPAPTVDLTPIVERLEAIERRVAELGSSPADIDLGAWVAALDDAMPAAPIPAGAPQATEVDLTPVLDRLDAIERRFGELGGSSPADIDLGAWVAALEEAMPPAPAPGPPQAQPVDLTPILDRLDSIEDELRTARSAPTTHPGQLVSLVEERLGAGLSAIVNRTEGALQAVGDLHEANERVARRLESLDASVRSIEVDAGAVTEPVLHGVQQQFELLTQRVAALHVGVEATRALLDQHVQDTANSLGRKAGEVGRRLAADFGLRTKRTDQNRTREIGPGA